MSAAPLAYLASPIDRAGHNKTLVQAKALATELLVTQGIGIYRPDLAWNVAGLSSSPTLQRLNNWAVDECDALVGVLLNDVPTIGTLLEIQRAIDAEKPVLLLTDINGSWALHQLIADAPNLTTMDATKLEAFAVDGPPRQRVLDWLAKIEVREDAA